VISTKEAQKKIFIFKINKLLCSRSPEVYHQIEGYITHLLNALDKIPSMDVTVYRGIPKNNEQQVTWNYKSGRKILWSGFTSTTTDLQSAKVFAGAEGIIFKIKALGVKNISPYSFYPREKEVMLLPNTILIVTSPLTKDKNSGYSFVKLQVEKCNELY